MLCAVGSVGTHNFQLLRSSSSIYYEVLLILCCSKSRVSWPRTSSAIYLRGAVVQLLVFISHQRRRQSKIDCKVATSTTRPVSFCITLRLLLLKLLSKWSLFQLFRGLPSLQIQRNFAEQLWSVVFVSSGEIFVCMIALLKALLIICSCVLFKGTAPRRC